MVSPLGTSEFFFSTPALFWICAIFSTVIAHNVMLAIVLGAYQDLRDDYLRTHGQPSLVRGLNPWSESGKLGLWLLHRVHSGLFMAAG